MQPDKHAPAARPTIRTQLVQMRVLPGQPALNTAYILSTIAAARQAGVELVLFPEMAVSGWLLGNKWEWPAFLRECEACGERIRAAASGISVVFGNVATDWQRRDASGRFRKYNALFVAHKGRFIGPRNSAYPFVIKALQSSPADDAAHFFGDLRQLALESGQPGDQMLTPITVAGWTLGCLLDEAACADAEESRRGRQPTQLNVDLLINISCARFADNSLQRRHNTLAKYASAAAKPLLHVNSVGIQNDSKNIFIGAGMSGVYDRAGQFFGLDPFAEKILTQSIPLDKAIQPGPVVPATDNYDAIYQALLYGIGEFTRQCKLERITIGLSGGIDSAVTAALCCQALGQEKLLLANLPGPFTSPTTIALARRLAANLQCYYVELPINASLKLTQAQLDGLEIASSDGRLKKQLQLNEAILENIQARDRSSRLLAALAAAFGGAYICNANKAEITVGYSTLYGDLAGFMAPIADLWKGEVYKLASYLNERVFQKEIIPRACFDLPPSAELSQAQNVDKNQGDPLIYPYHDRLFAAWVEAQPAATPEDILEHYLAGRLEEYLGYNAKLSDLFADGAAFLADLERWWLLYQGLGLAKRVQAPPRLALKEHWDDSRNESQTAPWFSLRYQELKNQILAT